MTNLLLKEEVFAIVGAAIEVHRELGRGFWKRCIRKQWKLNWRVVIFLTRPGRL